MTHDPYRNPDPYRDPNATGSGATILLGALLLAAIGGFIYFYSDTSDRVATNDIRPPITQPSTTGKAPVSETTGSSSGMSPAPEQKLEPKGQPVE